MVRFLWCMTISEKLIERGGGRAGVWDAYYHSPSP